MVEAIERGQPHCLVRCPTPEEQELACARVRLTAMQASLAARERDLAGLREQCEAFERGYRARVGVHIAELERLEAEIAAALARLYPDDARLREQARRNGRGALVATPRDAGRPRWSPGGNGELDDLRALYRAVARRIHPDFAADEGDRERRTRLMAEANRAYAAGDVGRLQELLDDWEAAGASGDWMACGAGGIAAALARVERAIARVADRLRAIAAEMAGIRQSELWLLRAAVARAERQGRDLLAELADQHRAAVALARKRLAALAARLRDHFGPRPARVLHFPAERALGTLFARPRGAADGEPWEELGAARGPVAVPAGMDARLRVRRRADLAPLATLRPDDLQVLELPMVGATNTALAHLGGLTGLRELDLFGNQLDDAGLGRLAALQGLRRLDVSRCYVEGDGLAALDGLGGLEQLVLAGPSLTDAALAHLGAFPLLRELDLAHSAVTDASLPHLAALTSLRRLDLAGSSVSGAGLAALRRALPDCAIAGDAARRRPRHPDTIDELIEMVVGD